MLFTLAKGFCKQQAQLKMYTFHERVCNLFLLCFVSLFFFQIVKQT